MIGEKFIDKEPCALILGDNIFYGNGLSSKLQEASKDAENGITTLFAHYVNDPSRFGVIEFDEQRKVVSIEEKPQNPKLNYIATGLYFYDHNDSEFAKQVQYI